MKNMDLGLSLAEKYYEYVKDNKSDINEHLPVLRDYAKNSQTITEFGVRSIVSTWAFVVEVPEKLMCVDIVHPTKHNGVRFFQLESVCSLLEIDFEFVLNDTLKIKIPDTDLLFIDTLHTYEQLSQELTLHAKNVKKWIIMHDTESCGDYVVNSIGDREGGLKYAIKEFLTENHDWDLIMQYNNNNGLTVLERNNK